ncbi:hypothetical protein C6Q21_00760 [Burkholderia multivorans]|uniref:hypothetical protein n=1 Tax=Burkholderia multivorans TaxID=87883 RepID=UPI000CFF112C|nr:hypothetical protein [Burkholderia multivorans]MCA7959529.1 hypothetical protein [Burkholderia multivorans]MDN7596701.1 hypothetical protein [Burkholderia multivorans]PRG15019.1 hypothetical protein C6Q21_00760 [Burkholderia multivorans]
MGDFATYQTPVSDEAEQPTSQTITANEGGTYSVTIDGSGPRSSYSSVSTINTAEDFSAFDAGDWRSTARTDQGAPTNEITKDSVVTIGGVTAKVETFAATGILQKQGDQYVQTGGNASGGQPQQAEAGQEQQEQGQGNDTALMPRDVVETIDRAVEGMSQATVQSGMSLAVAAAVGDIAVEDVAVGVARHTGLDPADAAQRTQFIIDAYQAQTDQFLTSRMGLSAEGLPGFYEWAKQPENKSALQEAIKGQLYGNSMAGWRPIVSQYFASVSPSADALKARGFETKQSSDGTTLVRIQGHWMSVSSAASAGFI